MSAIRSSKNFHYDIVTRLEDIAGKEDVEIKGDALHVIARNAEGAMRDAESIFDQITSFCGKTISAEDVTSILGLVSEDIYWQLNDAINVGNVEKGFDISRIIVEGGKHITRFIEELITHFRNLLIARSSDNPGELIGLSEKSVEKYIKSSGQFRREQLIYIMDVLADALDKIRFAISPRVTLEIALVKVIRSANRIYIDDILDKIQRDESTGLDSRGNSGIGGASLFHEEQIKSSATKQIPSQKTTNEATTLKKDDSPLQKLTNADIEQLGGLWQKALEGLDKTSKRLKEQLAYGKLLEVDTDKNIVKIGFLPEDSFHLETVKAEKNLGIIKNIFSQNLGKAMEVLIQKVIATENKKIEKGDFIEMPILKKAQEIFGGKFMNQGR